MTPTEIQNALAEFCEDKGHIYPTVSVTEKGLDAHFWPDGIAKGSAVHARGESFAEIIAAMQAKWDEIKDARAATKTKDMALAIIRITHERGVCTDAALRADFSGADVADYGEAATALANEMGERGPFSIVETAGANAA